MTGREQGFRESKDERRVCHLTIQPEQAIIIRLEKLDNMESSIANHLRAFASW